MDQARSRWPSAFRWHRQLVRRGLQGRLLDRIAATLSQKRRHSPAEFLIARAGHSQKGTPLIRLSFASRVVEFLDLPETLRSHFTYVITSLRSAPLDAGG